MFSQMRIRTRIILLFIAMTTSICLLYSIISIHSQKNSLLARVDATLEMAARSAEKVAGEGYHDEITGMNREAVDRFNLLVNQFDTFCQDLDLSYIWSVMRHKGEIVFTTATHSDKQDHQSECATFLEIHSNPEIYVQALDTQVSEFSTFDDKWGKGRMALIPYRDKHGRPYLFAASVQLGDLAALQRSNVLNAILLSLAIGSVAVLLSLFLARSLTKPISDITAEAERIAKGDFTAKVEDVGMAEIATLATSFNVMTDAIRRQVEELRAGEENLRITLNSIGDAVIATDSAGRITKMNPVAEDLVGWQLEEAQGKLLPEVFRIVNSRTRKIVENPVEKVLRLGQVVGMANHTILISRDGTEWQIADSGAPIRSVAGTIEGVILVFRDVTKEMSAAEEMRQSQKMQAIGQLAGGVAHDFNNLLSAIMGNAELLCMKLDEDSELLGFARQIFQASCRAEELTQQLLVFSRKGPLKSASINIHTMTKEVVNLLNHAVDRRITLTTNLQAESCHIEGDSTQLQNAILNLGLNARDAMKNGGDIIFTTRNLSLDADFCKAQSDPIEPGPFLEMAVSDSGQGMSTEIIKHIFEPFFSTKKPGEGTGLGLAAVHGCVLAHNGLIQVYSRIGEGSVFKILLPISTVDEPKVLEDVNLNQGEGVVMIVDDEELVRNFSATALRNLGYKVLTCVDGNEAVDIYRNSDCRIDIVVLDMIMPSMSGEDTYRLLKAIDPNVRVLLSSGFTGGETAAQLIEDGALDFLQKPYRIAELAAQIAKYISAALV
ncbi:MAG: response regulator [bacterium]|nr:response regulator [bacterium]